MKPSEITELVDEMLGDEQDNGENPACAVVVWEGQPLIVGLSDDLYDLIASDATRMALSVYENIAFVSYGWAAPLGENGEVTCPPSAHDGRRRLRLVYATTLNGETNSRLHFMDNGEVLSEDNEGVGALSDAIANLVGSVVGG